MRYIKDKSLFKQIIYIVIPLLLLLNQHIQASDVETPTTLAGGKIITAQQAKNLIQNNDGISIDTRSLFNFGKGHIPKAKHIGYKQKSKLTVNFDSRLDLFDITHLPKDKNKVIIFYSHGSTGWKSYKAAVLAIRNGYKNIHWLRDGYSKWKSSGYESDY